MTSRFDTLNPAAGHAHTMSDAEAARAEADAAQHAENRRRAAWIVAACARDLDEFRTLTDMLGLDHGDLAAARRDPPTRPGTGKRRAA